MPIGPGGLDSNGIWQFGEDDSEALASDLLNLGMGSVSTAISTLGGVLQVVSTTKTDATVISVAAYSFTGNVSGLTVAITPSATSSKVKIEGVIVTARETSLPSGSLRIMRDSTPIGIGDAAGSRPRVTTSVFINVTSGTSSIAVPFSFIDEPSTTSEVVYAIQLYNNDSATRSFYFNRSPSDSDSGAHPRSISTITASEVAG